MFVYEAYTAPPSYSEVLFIKLELIIVKLLINWTKEPPKSPLELINVEFTISVPSDSSFVPKSIYTAPAFLFAVAFINVQLIISISFASLSPIAPAVSLACKFSKTELMMLIKFP